MIFPEPSLDREEGPPPTSGALGSRGHGARRLSALMSGRRRWVLSFVVGCLIGILLHYMLYRLGLPLEPFIYVAF